MLSYQLSASYWTYIKFHLKRRESNHKGLQKNINFKNIVFSFILIKIQLGTQNKPTALCNRKGEKKKLSQVVMNKHKINKKRFFVFSNIYIYLVCCAINAACVCHNLTAKAKYVHVCNVANIHSPFYENELYEIYFTAYY